MDLFDVYRCVAAIRSADIDTIKKLLNDGLNPSSEVYTWSLLIHAIRENCLNAVVVLLEAGADWKGSDGYSRNALEVACLKVRNMEIVSKIVEYGATFSHEAFRAAVEGDLAYFEGQSDADIQELLKLKDSSGYGIVHYAAVQGQISFLDALHLSPEDAALESENDLRENAVLLVAYCGSTATVDHLISTYNLDHDSPRGSKDNTTSLLYASYAGYIEMLDHFVDKYSADPRTHKDDYGQTALLNAAYTGHIEMFDHLVEKYNFDPKADKNKGGKSPLLDGHFSMFLHLVLKYGFDPKEDRDKNGYSALLLSAWYGHVDFVDYLIFEHGCNVHEDRDVGTRTALINAIRNNKLHMVKHLVTVHRVDVGKEMDSEGGNVLINAARSGSVEILDYLVSISVTQAPSEDADVAPAAASAAVDAACGALTPVPPAADTSGTANIVQSAIHAAITATAAAQSGCLAGAMPMPNPPVLNVRTDRDKDQYSCLLTAIWYGKIPMIDHLVSKYGCTLEGERDKNGHGPLILAALGKQMDVLDHLTSVYGLKMDEERDRSGNTPLMIAAARGNIPMLDHMVTKHGCDPTTDRNKHELSCLLYAAMFQHRTMIDHLIETHHCGVLSDMTVDNENVLHFVADDGSLEILDHFLQKHEAGVLLQRKTLQEEESPFLRAIRFGKMQMVDHMISNHGADLLLDTDKHGNSALLVAAKYGQKSLIDHFLRKYRCDIATTVNAEGDTAPVVAAKRRQFSTEDYILGYYGCFISLPHCVNQDLYQFWLENEVEEENLEELSMSIEACMICYEVVDTSNTTSGGNNNASVEMRHLPFLRCGTCKHSVHPYCYHTWVKKSRKKSQNCIMCQQPMTAPSPVPPAALGSTLSEGPAAAQPPPAPEGDPL